LFDTLGFRAPFIFGVIAAVLDLIGRLLILERREALEWGHDPALLSTMPTLEVEQPEKSPDETLSNGPQNVVERPSVESAAGDISPSSDLSLWEVFLIILKSRRAMVACLLAALYGYVDFSYYMLVEDLFISYCSLDWCPVRKIQPFLCIWQKSGALNLPPLA